MRLALPLALACLALTPAAGAADRTVAVWYDLATGAVHVGAPRGGERVVELDACATLRPGAPDCTGVLGPHPALAPPPAYLQTILYPRQVVTAEGGVFELRIAWESVVAGIRCAIGPTLVDPVGFDIACEELDPGWSSGRWPETAWTLQGHQGETLGGAMEFVVLYEAWP